MASEYVPTTEMIREGYARAPFELDIRDYEIGQSAQGRAKAFDRWLAAHDRAVKAEAWNEGWDEAVDAGARCTVAGGDFTCGECAVCQTPNPYRAITDALGGDRG